MRLPKLVATDHSAAAATLRLPGHCQRRRRRPHRAPRGAGEVTPAGLSHPTPPRHQREEGPATAISAGCAALPAHPSGYMTHPLRSWRSSPPRADPPFAQERDDRTLTRVPPPTHRRTSSALTMAARTSVCLATRTSPPPTSPTKTIATPRPRRRPRSPPPATHHVRARVVAGGSTGGEWLLDGNCTNLEDLPTYAHHPPRQSRKEYEDRRAEART
jgi:hypothetical protein